jgi:hypothetical protein
LHIRETDWVASLLGRLVSSTSDSLSRRWSYGCHSQGPRFSSGSAHRPSHDGLRRMWRTNLSQRACRYRQHKPHNGLASSIVPAGHRSADRRKSPSLLFHYVSEPVLGGITPIHRGMAAFVLGRAEPSMPRSREAVRRKAQGFTASARTERSSGVPG